MGIIVSRDNTGNTKVASPYNPAYVTKTSPGYKRHHSHENSLQKAVQAAACLTGIVKPINVHTFRHCFATHLLEANYDQECALYRGAHRDLCSYLSVCYTQAGLSGKPRPVGDSHQDRSGASRT